MGNHNRHIGLTIFFIPLMTLSLSGQNPQWVRIDNFESQAPLVDWIKADTRNDTSPRVDNPQVTEVRKEEESDNHYLLKKPAADGIVGNRKALSFLALPVPVEIGKVYTFYVRFQVEEFPNNHVFGLSNLGPAGIKEHDYDALEPSLRITDKYESDGCKNDGSLMVMKGNNYQKIFNFDADHDAQPLEVSKWYEVWFVVDNRLTAQGGQSYDVYMRGGNEFPEQKLVYKRADFRMKRELPLIFFMTNCNTGPKEKPYGNGGLKYDDLYMAEGLQLSDPKTVIR